MPTSIFQDMQAQQYATFVEKLMLFNLYYSINHLLCYSTLRIQLILLSAATNSEMNALKHFPHVPKVLHLAGLRERQLCGELSGASPRSKRAAPADPQRWHKLP